MIQSSASSELVRAYARTGTAHSRIVRASLPSRQLGRRIAELAKERVPVLITGETGTGKTLVAEELKRESPAEHLNLTVNCASLADAQLAQIVFEHLPPGGPSPERTQGVLFLDEIGELSPWGQAVLLRALSDHDPGSLPRLLSSTHRDLEAMVQRGSFSGELLMRLRGVTLHLPPLRERMAEIGPLALHFVRVALMSAASPLISIEPEVITTLEQHTWPGNVRELRNVMTRAVAVCTDGFLRVDCLPEELQEKGNQGGEHQGA